MITVFGATGTTGAPLVDTLLAKGATVRAVTSDPFKLDAQKAKGCEAVVANFTDPAALARACDGAEKIYLVTPAHLNMRQWKANVIEAAKAAGVAKIVYTSIQGSEVGTAFSPVVQSNRQTEADIRASGLDWTIGRNGIYIEPDVEYIDSYRAKGEIANSAGDGKCGYTTRSELAHAYAALLTRDELNGQTFDLNGTPITQAELTQYMNAAYGTELTYRGMSAKDYVADRTAELGDFIGPIIGGIYDGIRRGAFDAPGDYEAATGRPHQSWEDYFTSLLR